ncbi:MAG: PBP1A family penicillin-binding protein [Candidatus Methylomirabilis oxygeniifera]|uniref:peptidoglycan glycosyltransferase n=1 Tax=Methylomirabilis oxygeniifera TaxID=671143 RepID=D5MHB3_METO1|nr:MAG: PBP1A family penicillin-binding protein [Candidatus Methylomirabilis oxyfera]CBE69145.1 Multimodular transpeptidase-transglycosylase [Candidatus Methylomirabilis oxyfera]
MSGQALPLWRAAIRPRIFLVLFAGVAVAWAVWHVLAGRVFSPTLLIYAAGAHTPMAVFNGSAYELREERPLSAYPPLLIDAVLLMEDRRFYEHHGVDLRAVMRAAWANAQHESIVQGGSTLTQQLARSRYLTRERTFSRKIKEAALALGMEIILSKPEILERYLNDVYLGQRGTYEVRGMTAASRHYLGKEPGALRPDEVALLVGLIRSPNTTSPLVSLRRACQRRDLVLRRMWEERRLSDADYRRALKERVRVVRDSTVGATHFLDFVRKELEAKLAGASNGGALKVFTTLDVATQQAAYRAVVQGLSKLDGRRKRTPGITVEGALVAVDVKAGAIKAMVGGRDYQRSQFNRAVQAKRQPGSLFKPFIYLAAFEAGRVDGREALTPAAIVEDRPLAPDAGNGRWRPRNFNGIYYGKVRLREALERSLNAATITIGEQVGLSRVIEQARASGIESPLRPSPATLLGASEVSVLEITAAYGTLARGGEWLRPHTIRRVEDGQGHLLFEERREVRRAASPQAAFLVTSMLRGAIERGTAASAYGLGLTREAAGKTGTSNDLRDAWFVGYTPDLIAGVWVGIDSGAPLQLTGAQAALPIWTQFIEHTSVGHPSRSFEPPPGIVTAKIDPASGVRLTSDCSGGVDEVFIQGTEPRATCPRGAFVPWRWVRHLFSR